MRRRFTVALVVLTLVLGVVAPAAAIAASPSSTSMLKEQVASQAAIQSLMGVAGKSSTFINTIYFGKAKKTATTATLPISARTAGGTMIHGVLVVKKYGTKWYFYSITRGGAAGGISNVAIPGGITTKSLGAAIGDQGSHQYLITGIIGGGYKKLSVTSRHTYSNSKQVNIKLSGGSRKSTTGRVLAYRKTASSGKKFWFVSSIK